MDELQRARQVIIDYMKSRRFTAEEMAGHRGRFTEARILCEIRRRGCTEEIGRQALASLCADGTTEEERLPSGETIYHLSRGT